MNASQNLQQDISSVVEIRSGLHLRRIHRLQEDKIVHVYRTDKSSPQGHKRRIPLQNSL